MLQRDEAIIKKYHPRLSTGRRLEFAAYEVEEAIKLAQMKNGNIAAFLNAQNYNFLCSGESGAYYC